MTPLILSIVGKSDSGKTTLIEKLLPEIIKRGYKVATIKHHSHDDFQIDVEGKDSWRHAKAGSSTVIISSPTKLAVIKKTEEDKSLNEIRARYCDGIDLVLTEGYKRERHPKIEIFRKAVHKELLCKDDDALVAIVSDKKFDRNVPQFGLDDIKEIVDFIEEKFLKVSPHEDEVSLRVNGIEMPLKPFIREIFKETISGLLKPLKGTKNAKLVSLEIKFKGK
ncbi:MAG: molybdopterin-guanine dinucleotide biosynthesis protein B [Candidatus Schekmanbacteria bacterium GWA2_38_11]|uniref:Molybdopterin-guanine dinucleotide biosynthesis protein B n=1 Tax=Candidatus Schekmanbacteria bacterium GWA2_38_11 TaxID=1817876 RepID=A0A1F7R9R7_9BACT|nr:MAG: molybdopterin-guanine dinucleotide biosynthesis protein B [Candidatus Schekmanbacteria bacterium GWA2_38_11]